MGFVTEVRMLANLFNSKKVIIELVEEYEKDLESLKEKIINLRGNIISQEDDFRELTKLEVELREDISSLSEKIQVMKNEIKEKNSEISILNEVESAEFIKTFSQKHGYKIEQFDFFSVGFALQSQRYYGYYGYDKKDFFQAINVYLQEISAKEGLSYTKLKKAVFDINPAWLEIYEGAADICYTGNTTTNLLLNTFMVPKKISKKEL